MKKSVSIILAVVLCVILVGCPSDSSSPTNPGTGGSASEQAYFPIVYYHVKDSDGQVSKSGVDAVLIFEPNGISHIYVASFSQAIAYHGSFSVTNSSVRLTYNDADIVFDKTFAIDTSKAEISMPFMLFTTAGQGTSTWRKKREDIPTMAMMIYNATNLSERMKPEVTLERVSAFLTFAKNASSSLKQGAQVLGENYQLNDFLISRNAVELNYKNGTTFLVRFYGNLSSTDGYNALELSNLASDPRVHLDCKPPGLSLNDPLEKTAFFFAPFDTLHLPGWKKNADGTISDDPASSLHAFGEVDKIANQEDLLAQRQYTIRSLKDGACSIENLIAELLPNGSRTKSPGYVYLSTHGFENGGLVMGTLIPVDSNSASLNAYLQKLKSLYPDLITFGGGTEKSPKTFAYGPMMAGWRPGDQKFAFMILPKFWEWLATKGADFSRSLVYVGACLTDRAPDLRNAIKARAYFGFNIEVDSKLAGSIAQYMVKSLLRPTHSAEEVYYNIIRTANTHQMIYVEDKILDRSIPLAKDQDPFTIFKGYGYDGSTMVDYQQNGWLKSDKVDAGAVWWMLFAGRWGQDAQQGHAGFLDCWSNLWSKGDMGGISSPGCNAATPGRVPTEQELGYTLWLLNSDQLFTKTIKRVPRYTLNDGAN